MMASNEEQEEVNCTFEYPDLPPEKCLKDENTDEIIVYMIIGMLVIYTFYKFYDVWYNKLNFSEVLLKLDLYLLKDIFKSILQGPQGWDLVLNLIMKKLKAAKNTKMFTSQIEEDNEDATLDTQNPKRHDYKRCKSEYFPRIPKKSYSRSTI